MKNRQRQATLRAANSEVAMQKTYIAISMLFGLLASEAMAADRFVGFNNTTSTDFTGVYLAPEGTVEWGPNQAQNDKDKVWNSGERLPIKGVSRARFELKLVDSAGRICIKHAIDLTRDTTFDVREEDLRDCKP
jgi:hypothetical protein